MEPSVQYTQTSDGISIAFWTLGEGRPFILMPGSPISPSLRAWRTDNGRAWLERLAATRMVVRYDNRGFGLSQKNVPDLSVDAHLSDLDAIITALATGPVDLCGYLDSGPIAIKYAARTPERVSHVVLWCASVRGGDSFFSPEAQNAMRLLLEADWELYTEALAAALRRGVGGDFDTHQFAVELRESMSPEMARAFASREPYDVRDVLSQVCTPTLLLHRRGIPAPPLDEVQRMAAAIPGARLVVLDGDSLWP